MASTLEFVLQLVKCDKVTVSPNQIITTIIIIIIWYRGGNSTTAEEVSRFQSLFPNPNWLVWGRVSRH